MRPQRIFPNTTATIELVERTLHNALYERNQRLMLLLIITLSLVIDIHYLTLVRA